MAAATKNSETSLRTRLVLASRSPRRRELIRALDLPVEAVSPDGDEGAPREGEPPREFVLRLSLEKARQVSSQAGRAVVLGADTCVVLDGQVLGKPTTEAEAAHMLRRLRGRVHTVVTGVTVLEGGSGRWLSAAKSTDVRMRDYSERELTDYVASGGSLDKAGGYAVQDERFQPAEDIEGCYLNVVGLPLCEVLRLLVAVGMEPRLRRDWELPPQCVDCPLKEVVEVVGA